MNSYQHIGTGSLKKWHRKKRHKEKMAQEKWHKVHDREKWHNFISVENRNKYIFQIVYFTDKKNVKGPPKKQKVALEPE